MLRRIKNILSHIYEPEEAHSIGIILMEHLGFTSNEIRTARNLSLSRKQKGYLESALERLEKGEPIQYVTGYAYFMNFRIDVSPSVLIPRGETEELVNLISDYLQDQPLSVLDIGTGSGCIAIALKKKYPQLVVSACDVSCDALTLARANANYNGAEINFFQADILHVPDLPAQYDCIVSNPPYVLEMEKKDMHQNVLDYEPESALFVSNDDPLVYYGSIIELALRYLRPDGKLFFEINETKGAKVAQLLQSAHFKEVEIIQDFHEKDRFAVGRNA